MHIMELYIILRIPRRWSQSAVFTAMSREVVDSHSDETKQVVKPCAIQVTRQNVTAGK